MVAIEKMEWEEVYRENDEAMQGSYDMSKDVVLLHRFPPVACEKYII